ncbi:hypothetical protein C465_15522 [Halorubrum distributum JCM 9100]|uniref:Uncharacterized protein n=2 Tax=Halorubrum distributum TaxID=29283 RepID=M0EDE1_9EURY|nr:hypothetical protein [Halorubrum distributum]ELZ45043.1 hypothetical protein C465_15522 [Halorubrum distributum JCM 9100]ELZ51345.1 hypothetical protein C466_13667 [Halorubrum distributum JCM 10118]
MNHDRVHAREPSHHVDRWTVGVVESIGERDGHYVVTVRPVAPEGEEGDEPAEDADRGEPVELTLTLAVRDLFVSRLPIDDGESPVGERVWYRKRGG